MFEIDLIICIKMDLELNNLRRLICRKTQTNQPVNEEDFSAIIKLENLQMEFISMSVLIMFYNKLCYFCFLIK